MERVEDLASLRPMKSFLEWPLMVVMNELATADGVS